MNLRCYTIVNQYISGLHAGIQSAHAIAEMMHSTERHSLEKGTLENWAELHKTIIVLEGGYQSNLEHIYNVFKEKASSLGLPFSKFNEEKDALNGALTALAIVVPESIYSAKFDEIQGVWVWVDKRSDNTYCLNPNETAIKEVICTLRLKNT